MADLLAYPFDVPAILRKRRSLRAKLTELPAAVEPRIAILGGSTTSELKDLLELFLLRDGLRPTFFESDYNKFFEDAVLGNPALDAFRPDVIIIHTTQVNVRWPDVPCTEEQLDQALQAELARFKAVWDGLQKRFDCVIIQNNFDPPVERRLGNRAAVEPFGRVNYLARLNAEFARHAQKNKRFFLNDLQHVASRVGLATWWDPNAWYSYKLAISPAATVPVAQNLGCLLRAVYGRTKKCLVLDLDNTLWGGVIGDDGVSGLQLGRETPVAEAYSDFQQYCLELKKRGVILAVCSKNELETAKEGFSHPDSVLKVSDFAAFVANWNPKHENIRAIAEQLNLGLDSFVFVDDNPAEREIVRAQLPQVAVPEVGSEVSRYAEYLDNEGYFETASVSGDDLKRSEYYAENVERDKAAATFASYDEFLASLEMQAEIAPFTATYLDRITQLTNKSNQFNLTTRRYTIGEMQALAESSRHITLYGRLVDRFGDNGLISVIVGELKGEEVHIDLWLMSCRVLKRGMEVAMLDALAARAVGMNARRLVGNYLRTKKNGMVARHYEGLGFTLTDGTPDGDTSRWELDLANPPYASRNRFIKEL